MRKKACQMQYEVHWVAISQYFHDALGQKMTKEVARREKLTLMREGVLDGKYNRLFIPTFVVNFIVSC